MSRELSQKHIILPYLLLFLISVYPTNAHDHHGNEEADTEGELDALLLLHISVQFLAWCIIFPIGLVFGFTRARWHVPLQSLGFLLTTAGYILGHKHVGWTFPVSLHAEFASFIMLPICIQSVLGVYLKLHVHEGTTFRHWIVFLHRIVGLSYLAIGWTQVILGFLVLGGICPLGKTSTVEGVIKCAEPFITGSLITQYGVYSYLFTLTLSRWKGQSPETWDSALLCIGGIASGILTYWGLSTIWLGLIWFVGGILSFLLSRKGRRTVIPSVLVAITGIIELFKPKADSQFVVTSTLCSLLVGASILRCTEIVLDTSKAQGVHSSRWKSASSMAFVSAGVVYMTLSPDLLEAMGFQQFYTFSYLGFILGMSLALVGFLLFLGHLYGTTGRNARGHATSRASIQFRPSPVERNVSTPLDGGDMASKFVVTDDSDEDEESGMLRRNGVQEYPLHATHHEALRNGHLEDDEELRERA